MVWRRFTWGHGIDLLKKLKYCLEWGDIMKVVDFMIEIQPLELTNISSLKLSENEYYDVDFIPVINEEQKYVGSITKEILIELYTTETNSKNRIASLLRKNIHCITESADVMFLAGATNEAVVVDEQGRVKGVITKNAIISALLTRLKGYQEQFETVINAAENGILAVNSDGIIMIANQTVSNLLGLEITQIIGRYVTDVVPNTLLPHIMAIRKPLLGQKIMVGNTTIVANCSPIVNSEKIVGAVSVFQDVSILEKVACELDEVKSIMHELEKIIDSSYDGMTVTDGNGMMLRVNNAYERLTGIKGVEIIGKNMKDLINAGYYDQSVTLQVMEKKERVTINQTIRGNRKVLVTGSPIFSEDGKLVRVVNNCRDITDLTNLQNEITKSREDTIRYQSEISHLRAMQLNSGGIVYRSQSIERAIETAQKVANVNSSVLITGESGTGKELIAKLIHTTGMGIDKPFIKLNCAALPENLLESELFGYEPGSFTGAKREGKPGLFELAHNGTLFLDEIGDMPLVLQVKMLRVLQEKEIMRIGGAKPISVNVRIIAATHRDLAKMADEGNFRFDLYYRLMVVPIHLPPLRERKQDIPILIRHFMDKYNQKFKYNKSINNHTVDELMAYWWKGNVRELENVIECMIVTSNDNELTVEHLPEFVRRRSLPNKNSKLKEAVERTEAYLLAETFKEYRSWDEVAKQLGIDRATTYRKAGKYKLLKR